MKIQLKDQIKNKYWWLSVCSATAMLLQLLGVELPGNYVEIVNAALALGVAVGILNNNATDGFGE